jgi:hypothetical protein
LEGAEAAAATMTLGEAIGIVQQSGSPVLKKKRKMESQKLGDGVPRTMLKYVYIYIQ